MQKDDSNQEALSRLFELLETQKVQQQNLLSRLTQVASHQEAEARKTDIFKSMYNRDMKKLRELLEATPASEMAVMRDTQGMSLVHHLVRTGLGPALEYVLKRVPNLADSVTIPSGSPANWTPLMVLVDAPTGSLGGEDYAYQMLLVLLSCMSATGIQRLGVSWFKAKVSSFCFQV